MREIDIVSGINSCSSFFKWCRKPGNLVNGSIVADHYSVKSEITAKYIGENPMICNTVGVLDSVIAGHECSTAFEPNHCFVWQDDFLHQFLFFGIATATVSKIMFCTRSNTFLKVTLL